MSPDPRLSELIERWRQIAICHHGNMRAITLRGCAEDLAAVLLGGTPQHEVEEEKEDAARVAPSVPRVAPPGSIAEKGTGAVTAAERTDEHGRRYIELPAGVGRYETKPERIYLHESRGVDGDTREKGTVVGGETSAPAKPTTAMNAGTGLEGRSGKPSAAEPPLPATSDVSSAVEALGPAPGSNPGDSLTLSAASGGIASSLRPPVPCQGCEKGLPVVMVDADGTFTHVSKRPGVPSHAVDDAWWPCPRWQEKSK